MYSYIINPENLKKFNIFSENGKKILKYYVKNTLDYNAGSKRGRTGIIKNFKTTNRGKTLRTKKKHKRGRNLKKDIRRIKAKNIEYKHKQNIEKLKHYTRKLVEFYSFIFEFKDKKNIDSHIVELKLTDEQKEFLDNMGMKNYLNEPNEMNTAQFLQKKFELKGREFLSYKSVTKIINMASIAIENGETMKGLIYYLVASILILTYSPDVSNFKRWTLENDKGMGKKNNLIYDILEQPGIYKGSTKEAFKLGADIFPNREEYNKMMVELKEDESDKDEKTKPSPKSIEANINEGLWKIAAKKMSIHLLKGFSKEFSKLFNDIFKKKGLINPSLETKQILPPQKLLAIEGKKDYIKPSLATKLILPPQKLLAIEGKKELIKK